MTYSFGRHVQHDPLSRVYAIDHNESIMSLDIVSRSWTVMVPVMDQGDLGACVGYATAAQIGTAPIYHHIPLSWPDLAVALYSSATRLDEIPGQYPPFDTGSSGIGGAKAAKAGGWISGYTHAFSFEALCKALQIGPVMAGTNWYRGMTYPDVTGIVCPDVDDEIEGGHEYLIYGINVEREVLLAQNSWGVQWGVNGRFAIPYSVMRQLLSEDGDITQFTAIDDDPPVPVPAPPAPPPEPAPAAPTWEEFWAVVRDMFCPQKVGK